MKNSIAGNQISNIDIRRELQDRSHVIQQSVAELDKSMDDEKYAGLRAERGAICDNIAANKMLLDSLAVTVTDLENKAISIFEAVDIVDEQKSNSIKSIRDWRKTVTSEAVQIDGALKAVTSLLTDDNIARLEKVALLMERIESTSGNELIDRLLKGNK